MIEGPAQKLCFFILSYFLVNKSLSKGKCSEFTLLNKIFDKIFTFLQKKGRDADKKPNMGLTMEAMEVFYLALSG
jgi:hypothetical protein